jgi:hypothetical protein
MWDLIGLLFGLWYAGVGVPIRTFLLWRNSLEIARAGFASVVIGAVILLIVGVVPILLYVAAFIEVMLWAPIFGERDRWAITLLLTATIVALLEWWGLRRLMSLAKPLSFRRIALAHLTCLIIASWRAAEWVLAHPPIAEY